MKKILISLIVVAVVTGLSAQDTDSLLLVKFEMLKKELVVLKKNNKTLQARIYTLKNSHARDIQEIKETLEASEKSLQQIEQKIEGLTGEIQQAEASSMEGISTLGAWTKKMIMILTIAVAVLFLVLLVLVITNRRRIEGDYRKLEAKVDNTKEAIDLEIKDVLKRHEEDIVALKAGADKNKK